MSKKIKNSPIKDGDCVEVQSLAITTGVYEWVCGIVLSYQLVEMEDHINDYLYTVHSPVGVDDYWSYEIRLVNFN